MQPGNPDRLPASAEAFFRFARKPAAAAFFSAVFPGLGQALAGQPRRGAIVAIPGLATLAAFLFLFLFARSSLFGLTLNGGWLTSILLLDVFFLAYRLWAIVDAYLVAARLERPPERRRRSQSMSPRWPAVAAVVAIVAVSVLPHAAFAKVDMDWQRALYCLTAKTPCWVPTNATFDPGATDIAGADDNGPGVYDTPTPEITGPTPSITPMPTIDISALSTFSTTTDAENWDADGQLNVMLLGLGVQTNKAALGPDTIMVMHASMTTGQVELISVGRNNYCTPLPTQEIAAHYQNPPYNCPAGTWGPMLNGLPNEILGHCDRWPIPEYASTCGKPSDPNLYQRAYKGFEMTIGNLLGLHIDGSMWINPIGLTTLIDTLGGVDITVKTRLYDKPCGPNGSKQQQIASTLSVPGTNTCQDTSHWGYYVPTGSSGVQNMKNLAASSNGGLAVYSVPGIPSNVAFVIQPGTYHMNGDWALAYARTRIYDPQGDFGRAARQQNLLSSLRRDLDPCHFASLENVAPLLGAVTAIPYGFNTDLDVTNPDNIKAWANLAKRVLGDNIQQIVLTPQAVGMDGYAWDANSVAKARQLVIDNFKAAPVSSPGAGSSSCG